jgi:phosphinothricin acetyltransferase
MSTGAATQLTIRYGEVSDLPKLTAIYNHYVINSPATFDLEPLQAEKRAGWFAEFGRAGRYRLFVAERDGEVVGYAHTRRFRERPAYDITVESTAYCAHDAVGQGAGSALYAALFQAIAAEDVHLVIAGITLPNDASVALHEKFGFSLSGVMHEVGRKFGRFWDVATYEKRLP